MEKHELVDKNGNRTGKVLTHIEARELCNIPEGQYMPVAGVVIVNDKDEVLFQRRSKFKRVNPSKWGICGGKVDYGEAFIDACVRETLEEIGVDVDKEELKFLSNDINGKAYFSVYYVRKNVDINECKLQEEEVEELRYFKVEEIGSLDSEGVEWLDNLKKVMEANK